MGKFFRSFSTWVQAGLWNFSVITNMKGLTGRNADTFPITVETFIHRLCEFHVFHSGGESGELGILEAADRIDELFFCSQFSSLFRGNLHFVQFIEWAC